jgi:hypothetical protein
MTKHIINGECKICNLNLHAWNDIFIIFNREIYCVECYERITGKQIKITNVNFNEL